MNPATSKRKPTTAIIAALQAALNATVMETNLVPSGQTYQIVDEDTFTLNGLTVGKQYRFTPGANETKHATNGAQDLIGPCNFTASDPHLSFTGADGKPVTAFVSELAFQRIETFDSENLVEAFQFLIVTEQRVCVIVPLDEQFQRESKNTTLIIHRNLPVALLISDRVLGNRKAALFGSATELGAYGLMELALPAVTGQLIANPAGVRSEPSNVSVMTLRDTEKKLPNRVTVCLELECTGGRLEAAVTPVT